MALTEAEKQYQREYRERNKKRLRVKSREDYAKNREKRKQYTRDYYQKHQEQVKANAIRTGKILRVKQRMAVLAHYSNGTMACVRCGFADIRALCLDHLNGGGTEHRRVVQSGVNVWLWLARHGFPPGYQILCANCNTIKAREEGEYGGNSRIKDDWRSQLEQMRKTDWTGKHKTWEDRLDETYNADEIKSLKFELWLYQIGIHELYHNSSNSGKAE